MYKLYIIDKEEMLRERRIDVISGTMSIPLTLILLKSLYRF